MRSFEQRLAVLGVGACHEHDLGSTSGITRAAGGVYHSVAGGRRVALLKVLQSSFCHGRCHYCAFRATVDQPRASLTPEEMARHFLELHRRRRVEGLFLSSGIHGTPDNAMQRITDTAALVRRAGFSGYVHLKILPGASDSAVERAVSLADRVSVNLEAPSQAHLNQLAACKRLEKDLLAPLRLAARLARRRGLRAGLVTQFVVGAARESDAELLHRADGLYRQGVVRRCYYSPFAPPSVGPLAGLPPASPDRMVRLSQADWLLRFYGFGFDELPLSAGGFLDPRVDPKTQWARLHPECFPVEVATAPREVLLRVPGIGLTTAERLVTARRQAPPRDARDLSRIGVRLAVAGPYLTLRGKLLRPVQLSLPGSESWISPSFPPGSEPSSREARRRS